MHTISIPKAIRLSCLIVASSDPNRAIALNDGSLCHAFPIGLVQDPGVHSILTHSYMVSVATFCAQEDQIVPLLTTSFVGICCGSRGPYLQDNIPSSVLPSLRLFSGSLSPQGISFGVIVFPCVICLFAPIPGVRSRSLAQTMRELRSLLMFTKHLPVPWDTFGGTHHP